MDGERWARHGRCYTYFRRGCHAPYVQGLTRRRGERGELQEERTGPFTKFQMREIDEITREIVDCAYHLHFRLGPGLLESVYEMVLGRMLERRGLQVRRQVPVTFEFDGMRFEDGFRADLLVEDRVVVERFRFRPATMMGEPVRVLITMPIRFTVAPGS